MYRGRSTSGCTRIHFITLRVFLTVVTKRSSGVQITPHPLKSNPITPDLAFSEPFFHYALFDELDQFIKLLGP